MQRLRECEVRLLRTHDRRSARRRNRERVAHNHCGRARRRELGLILRVGDESDVALLRLIDTGDAMNVEIAGGGILQSAAEALGEIAKLHNVTGPMIAQADGAAARSKNAESLGTFSLAAMASTREARTAR